MAIQIGDGLALLRRSREALEVKLFLFRTIIGESTGAGNVTGD